MSKMFLELSQGQVAIDVVRDGVRRIINLPDEVSINAIWDCEDAYDCKIERYAGGRQIAVTFYKES